MSAVDAPLIFLDVDGPLIPFRSGPISRKHPSRDAVALAIAATGNPLLDRLNPDDGHKLLSLECPLVWATTWMTEANEVIAPLLGLPELPVVIWPDEDDEPQQGMHWKTMALTRWAAGRPFVWLDDEVTDADRRWVEAHHPARALLHRVDPSTGLTEADFTVIRGWLS